MTNLSADRRNEAASESHISRIRVLLCDDHDSFAEAMAGMLSYNTDIDIVATADSGDAAVEAVGKNRPDVVLMDLSMPGSNGAQATESIKRSYPEVEIVILTAHKNDDRINQAISAGAKGYILKDDGVAQIASAVRHAAQGSSSLHPEVARRLIGQINPSGSPALTGKERQFAKALADYDTQADIADALGYAESSVRNALASAAKKLGLSTAKNNRILAEALRQGYIDLD